jgi:hypothetical protein
MACDNRSSYLCDEGDSAGGAAPEDESSKQSDPREGKLWAHLVYLRTMHYGRHEILQNAAGLTCLCRIKMA